MTRTFRKTGPESALGAFEAEAEGLDALRAAGEVRVPEVLGVGIADGQSYLEIEHLHLVQPTADVAAQFGKQLAALHRHTGDCFGWHRDNTIGLTPQVNTKSKNWAAFFREHRLGYQVRLAHENGYDLRAEGEALSKRLAAIFGGRKPRASLLHGDLWGGNWGSVAGEPVTFDPAVYYGDRESDIAMTMLFGGFGREFYRAYEKAWPMARGHDRRIRLYQLYHVLNHLNLFGRSYLGRARQLFAELAAR